jgi:hypothetical protein
MTTIKAHLRRWFLKIEEPRVQRILYLFFYLTAIITGLSALWTTPDKFYQSGGVVLVDSLGVFFVVGGLCGAIAILPGTWWLERVGLLSLAFGLAARGISIISLGVSTTGALIFLGEILLLVIRFIQIRRADLAPISK